MKASWQKYKLEFKTPAGTSRGVLKEKDCYFIILQSDLRKGIGECGLLRGLSADDRPDYEDKLNEVCAAINEGSSPNSVHLDLNQWPSIQAGLEMASLDFQSENHILFPSDFTDGLERQPINGLIWMGDKDHMLMQVRERIERGFLVLKMKIGAIDIESELDILSQIRKEFGPHEIQLRVDANGAFEPKQAPRILSRLDQLRIHSIEQPIKAGQPEEMAKLCEKCILPIALDEELIGVYHKSDKEKMLDFIKPQFIILKPSFLGGFKKSEEWIEMAEKRHIGWWVTSALESNLGLNAISQWNYTLYGHLASGLGTGSLYTNNFETPLRQVRGTVAYEQESNWDLSPLNF